VARRLDLFGAESLSHPERDVAHGGRPRGGIQRKTHPGSLPIRGPRGSICPQAVVRQIRRVRASRPKGPSR
jgi:hypothetical protein